MSTSTTPQEHQPPGKRRQTADVYGQDPNAQRPMGAQMHEDPGLWKKIRDAISRIVAYFINLIRAICGHAPYAPAEQAAKDGVVEQKKAENLADGKNMIGEVEQKSGNLPDRKLAPANDPAFSQAQMSSLRAANDPVNDEVSRFGSVDGDLNRTTLAISASGEQQSATPDAANSHLVSDDAQRLFAVMAESLAQCVQTCQQDRPFVEGVDAQAYLQTMSDRFQGAIAGLRTQQAFHLDSAMARADADFESGSGDEVKIAERWLTDGAITPDRAQALREIASAQMLAVMSQIARLGMREQALQAEGLDDPALSREIQQMLNDSTRPLAQASVFARAAGSDPANLVREVQAKLNQRLQQDIVRDHNRREQSDMSEREQYGEQQNWDHQYRPA